MAATSATPTLHVRIVGAYNLKNVNGATYCKLKLKGIKQKTKKHKKSNTPHWDETFQFADAQACDFLEISVCESALGSSTLGLLSIPVSCFTDGLPKESRLLLKGTPKAPASGDIHAVYHLTKPGVSPSLDLGATPPVPVNLSTEGRGNLFVRVIDGKGLAVKDLCGTSDPYCVLSYMDQEYRTRIVDKDLNPVWDEEFYFDISDENQQFKIDVYDYDMLTSDDYMGWAAVRVGDCEPGVVLMKSLILQPKKREHVSGFINVQLIYTNATQSSRNYQVSKLHYNDILALTVDDHMTIPLVLCNIFQTQELVSAIYNIFECEKLIFRFTVLLFNRELSALTSEAQLFRLDSPATKLSSVFMKRKGNKWLGTALGDIIREILKSPAGFEIDPDVASKGEDIEANCRKLEALAERFFAQIVTSVATLPLDIKMYLTVIRQVVQRSVPAASLKAVGALLFLRYICPAISSPEIYSIVPLTEPPSKVARRPLVLVTKVLQCLANQTLPGDKEPYMRYFSTFIQNHSTAMQTLFDQVSNCPSHEGASWTDLPIEEKLNNMAIIVKSLRGNMAHLDAGIAAELTTAEKEMPTWSFPERCTNFDQLPKKKQLVVSLSRLICEGL
ncbi:RasGTPase-activating protein [Pelomyxa schiedti]|nr:RasGTPase-activating protein [Pelomyxa schiedti]